MQEKRFRDNVTWMSFLLTLLVIWTHALNTELFLGDAGRGSPAELVESLLGEHFAQIAVPGFFMMSAVLFFRNYRPEDTLLKWRRRFHSLVIPYFSWNLLYYTGYLIATRVPGLRDVTGKEAVPFSAAELLQAAFLYKYNHVFWFVFQLILLALLSPLVWCLVQQRLTYLCTAALLCVFIFSRANPTPLNADALLYYMTGARAVTVLAPRAERAGKPSGRQETGRLSRAGGRKASAAKKENGGRLYTGLAFMCAALAMYGIYLLCGNDLPLVLSRLAAAASLWTLLLCMPLPSPRPMMYETFLIYAIHFAPVRLINKCAALLFPGSAAAALITFLLMPAVILGVAWIANKIGERFAPGLFRMFTGGR